MSTVIGGLEQVPALAPTAGWGNLDPDGHSVHFYADDGFLLDGLSRFMGSTLGAGDVGVVIATPEHRAGLVQRLKIRGFDLDLAGEQGRFLMLDADEILATFMIDGKPDAVLFAASVGSVIERLTAAATGSEPRVAAFGEMVARLWANGNPEGAIRLERLWNNLAQTHRFNLQCAYPLSFFGQTADGALLEKVCDEHTRVIPAESYTGLIDAEHRLRTIVVLQQKAQALETEVEERKRVEQALLESVERAEAAVQARDEFLSIAAHELKTPVTALKGSIQLLLRRQARGELNGERLLRTLAVVEDTANRLTQLTTDLLDVSRVRTGHLELACESVDFGQLIRRAIDRLSDQIGDGHRLLASFSDEPAIVCGDPDRPDQVLTNLLENALKYSPDGGEVAVELQSSADDGIQFTIRDQGIGLAPGCEESIFEPFGRAPNAAASHLPGMGLGLHICRSIVERHAGQIRAESAGEGQGTTIVVWLPRDRPSADPSTNL